MSNRARVFISYSHDSEQHLQFVLELAERLLEDGFNCVLDFYLEETPVEGWQTWLATELAAADFCLVVCTPLYLQHYQQDESLATDPEAFNGLILTQASYPSFATEIQFVPILPIGGKLQDIIPPLQGKNTFELMTDYLGLHQLLKNRPIKTPKTTQSPSNQWIDSTEIPTAQAITTHNSPAQGNKEFPTSFIKSSLFLYLILIIAVLMLLFFFILKN